MTRCQPVTFPTLTRVGNDHRNRKGNKLSHRGADEDSTHSEKGVSSIRKPPSTRWTHIFWRIKTNWEKLLE